MPLFDNKNKLPLEMPIKVTESEKKTPKEFADVFPQLINQCPLLKRMAKEAIGDNQAAGWGEEGQLLSPAKYRTPL